MGRRVHTLGNSRFDKVRYEELEVLRLPRDPYTPSPVKISFWVLWRFFGCYYYYYYYDWYYDYYYEDYDYDYDYNDDDDYYYDYYD